MGKRPYVKVTSKKYLAQVLLNLFPQQYYYYYYCLRGTLPSRDPPFGGPSPSGDSLLRGTPQADIISNDVSRSSEGAG